MEKSRKQRTRQLISDGGTIRAVLNYTKVSFNNNEIAGILLAAINQLKQDPQLKGVWADQGDAFFSGQAKEQGETIIISFKSEPEKEVKDAIKALGFRWNSIFRKWYRRGVDEESRSKILSVVKNIDAEIHGETSQ